MANKSALISNRKQKRYDFLWQTKSTMISIGKQKRNAIKWLNKSATNGKP